MAKNDDIIIKEILQSILSQAPDQEKPDQENVEDEVNRKKRLENDHIQQKLDLQKEMFEWVRAAVKCWLIFIAAFLSFYVVLNLALSAFGFETFVLESEILIALLATTTLNILGLPFIIAKSLFQAK
ncbi:MAG: hypothetical protein R3E13_09790 [Alphaproteobacteria bacterium]